MNIFLALCNKCDGIQMEDVIKMFPLEDKVSTVNCNSCGYVNSVLMFTVIMPEPPDDDKNLGDGKTHPLSLSQWDKPKFLRY